MLLPAVAPWQLPAPSVLVAEYDNGSTVEAPTVATSLIVLTVLYGVLAVVEIGLFVRYARAGAPELQDADEDTETLAFAY